MKLRLALSPCPNDTFVFYALLHNKIPCSMSWEPVLTDIESLNEMALNGKADVCKVSMAAYPLLASGYYLLSSGSALGYGCGPLLVGRQGQQHHGWQDPIVAIPGMHTTANLLLSLFFPWWRRRLVLPYDRISEAVQDGKADAGVLIHESRFTYEAAGLAMIADLGALWEKEFGLPVPLGGIVALRSLPQPLLAEIGQAIRQSLVYARSHQQEVMPFVRQHARELSDDILHKHISLFVNDFTDDLGAEGRQAVLRLLQHGHPFLADLPVFPEDTLVV
ncbi:MAG: 1,4-dihydroxy-6-naphthoate synthase [Chitinophagales bacterium]|nr:1,4-dihydroxy-6-naphthoate synthase [Chitinophagales bacterium]MDW8392730.1 1,4-dihydroxy-6-naphthoate synthase [Chitinophagales bacterium]